MILSSVRTSHPGFLKSQPRMNVALTRCRKGMVVVTAKSFLERVGKSMLLGKLCRTWSQRHEACWIDWKAMLNNSVALPGLPLPLPPPIPTYGMLVPALAVQQLALHRAQQVQTLAVQQLAYRAQQVQTLARINEQSRLDSIHSPGQRTAKLPRDLSSSKPKTWSQLSQAIRSTSALGSANMMDLQRRTTVTAADLGHPTVGQTERRGGRGGIPTAAAASGEVDDKFPSLQQLATALDQPSSSRRRKSKR